MRDPKRIARLLELYARVWEQCPDLRFYQLSKYIAKRAGYPEDPFYCEDDKIIDTLTTILSESQNSKYYHLP